MASLLERVRAFVKAKVDAVKGVSGYVLNAFITEETYLPIQSLPNIDADGKVWFIGLGSDDSIISRGKAFQKDIPIQVAIQAKVDATDLTAVNQWVELEEQIRKSAAQSTEDESAIAWLRNEALRDENGTPYSYGTLREEGIFLAVFTAVFQVYDQ